MAALVGGQTPTEASEEPGTRPTRAAPEAAEASEALLEAMEDLESVVPEATRDVTAGAEATRGVTVGAAMTAEAVTIEGAAVARPRTTGANRWPGTSTQTYPRYNTGVRLFRYTSDCLQILKVVYHRQICTIHQSFRLMYDPTLFARNWRGGPWERLAGAQGHGQQINHGSDVSSSYTVEEKEEF